MTAFKNLLGIMTWSVVALCLVPIAVTPHKTTDYQQELGQIQQELVREQAPPTSPFRNAYRLFLKSGLTGDPKDRVRAETAIGALMQQPAPVPEEAHLLQASQHLKAHRLDQARTALETVSNLDDRPGVGGMRADLAIQEGEYQAAETLLLHLLERNPQWDNLARLAYLRWKAGDFDAADRYYRAAQDELSAKEMRSYAWVELQRGLMALSRGHHELANIHYRNADKAYSGYWLVQDYEAELLAVERRFDAAIALYRNLIACTPRPELYQALGDLYSFMGQSKLARPWHDRALAAYLDSVRRGEVQYYHSLATFFSDARQVGEAAVKWARLDKQLRPNAATGDALAWALYRDGRYPEALAEIQAALASGWQDAHLFFHAAMIHLAAAEMESGKQWLKKAARLNPRYDAFHVHR